LGDYSLLPPELSKLHCLNFLKERQYDEALEELLRHLSEPLPKLGPFLTSVPSLPPNYLPRTKYFNQLKELVMADIQRPVVITSTKQITALQGMGGIGKSVLAAALCRTTEIRRAFNDGILWVTVGLENPDLIGNIRLIGTELGDDPAKYNNQKQAEASLTKKLSEKVCLIVLDDIWDAFHVTPFFNALGPRCRLLITTRNFNVVTSHGAQECKVDVLSEPDALKLMADWSEKNANSLPPEAKEVAEECGNLPLALSMCAAMAKSGRSWSGILNALKSANLKSIKFYLPNYPNTDVMKALKVSIDFLANEDPNAVQRYQELVIFPEDEPVPEAAILILWAYTGNLDDWNIEELLILLKERSLLRIDGEAPNRLISLHDLQKDYLRATADDLPYLHNQLLKAYNKGCGNKWDNGPTDGYFFEHLAYHLVEAGRKEELRKLLFDFNWIQSKLNATDVHFLIHDYVHFPEDYPVQMVKGAIQLSANALSKDKKLLDGQLLGRLELFSETKIKSMMEYIRTHKNRLRILPLTGSLTPPGGPLLRTLEGHSHVVWAVSITPDGNYAISSSEDNTLKVWNLKTGEEICTLKGHSLRAKAVSITPDGNYAVSASWDHTLKIWDLKNGREVRTLKGHSSAVHGVCVTPDGNYAVSASANKTLKIWDLKTGKEAKTLKGHSSSVNSVSVTPDGNYAISASADKTLKIWNLKTGKEAKTLKGHFDSVTAVSVTHDGNHAISASYDRTLKVWDLKTGMEVHTLRGHSSGVLGVSVTPDGNYAISASSDRTLKVWDLKTGKEERTLEGHSSSVEAVCVTPDGNYAVSASVDNTLKIWDLKVRNEVRNLMDHSGFIYSISVTPDGNYAISASGDNTLKVWDLKVRKEVRTLYGHSKQVYGVSITPDGNYAVSASWDNTLKVWDLKTGEKVRTLEGHSSYVFAVCVTPDGNYVISASWDHLLKMWDLKTGKEERTFKGHSDLVNAVCVTPDGNYAVSASHDKTLKVWDLKTGKEVRTLQGHSGWVKEVCITPDGNYAVSASRDYTLKVWDLKIGAEIHKLTGHSGPVNSVSVTQNGNYVVSASEDNTLKVWSLKTGEEVAAFSADSPFWSVVFSPDNCNIIAGEQSGRIHFLVFDKGNEYHE
jgi:WD40 repeat protein